MASAGLPASDSPTRPLIAARSLRFLIVAVLLLAGGVLPRAAAEPGEVRALWVLRSSLTSPASISSLVRTAHDQGFNTLLVQVRGRGDAYYRSSIEPRAADLSSEPASFDPLATVLTEAHRAGIRVHAWVSVNLISSAVELPASHDHLVYTHPEWLMVPRAIAQELQHVDPFNPGYVGRISRWTRDQLDEVEGLYASPLQPDAAAYTRRVIADLVQRYDVDGVHLDYARFPSAQFDYSRFAIAEFRADVRPRIGADLRKKLDAQQVDDLFAYPDALPQEWAAFRRARQTALVSGIREAVHAARPHAMVTAAVVPDPQQAFDQRLQDWRSWVDTGLVDAICPMAYAQDPAKFAEQITAARAGAGSHTVWAGIGAYRLPPAQTVDDIQTARKLGVAGIVLFSYDSLTGPKPPAPDYLATVSRAAFGIAAADSSPK
jgi:uncharacterized lipoprotein YddW (UPF0748 family)